MSNYCAVADVRLRGSGLTSTSIDDPTVQAQMQRAMSVMVPFIGGPYTLPVDTGYDVVLADVQADIAAGLCLRYLGAAEGVPNLEADRLRKQGIDQLREIVADKRFWSLYANINPAGQRTASTLEGDDLTPFDRTPGDNTLLNNFTDPSY